MKTFLITILISAGVFAQDQTLVGFNNATDVNNALVKAASAISGSGVANQIAYFTGTTTVGSLSTATYPSLTELARVKGVTSPIQTQINAKQNTLVSGTTIKTINNQSLLGSGNIVINSDTTGLWLKIYNEVKAQILAQLTGNAINGTVATLDSMIADFRKNNFLRLNK